MSISSKCRALAHRLFNRAITQEEFDEELKRILGKQGSLDLKPKGG